MDIKEYKCPNCGGTVNFDSSSQKMKCPYCDTEFEAEALEEYQKKLASALKDDFKWTKEGAERKWESGELDDLGTISCPSCGAEHLSDKNAVAMMCPYCGNAQILGNRLSGFLKPDYIIPFKLKKPAATEALINFCKGKKLLPSFFQEENYVNGMQGLYVPFWLFDAVASGSVRYKATKVSKMGNYTKTDFYSVERSGSIAFEKIPVDGSEKMDDRYMDAIEPFDYKQMESFQTSFLPGYVAEKYDVDAEKSKERAVKRIKSSLESEFARSVSGYSSVKPESSFVKVSEGKVSYALFPVWVLNTKYKDENYTFMMNGQSGRLVGKLPIDSGKAVKYSFLYSGIAGIVSSIAILLLWLFDAASLTDAENAALLAAGWVMSFLIGFGYVHSWKANMNTAMMKTEANKYMAKDSIAYTEKTDKFLYSKKDAVKQAAMRSLAPPLISSLPKGRFR